jgi:protein SCO1/2
VAAAPVTPPPPPIGGAFQLVNTNGQAVTEAALLGHPSLLAFGYSNCTQDCPPLAELGTWLDTVGDDGADIAVYFVSVDPERDTPEALAAYLGQFNPRIVGLTGTPDQVDAMLDVFQVDHDRLAGNAGGYDVEHPGWFYMHDAAAAFAGRINYGDPQETTLRRLRGLALASYTPERLDALCGTLRATNRAATLAAWPSTLWLTCAQRGFTEAQYGLALILDEGVYLTRDPRAAFVWATRAGQNFSDLVIRLQDELRPAAVEAAITEAQNWTPTR